MQQEIIFKSLNILFKDNNDKYFACSDGSVWAKYKNGKMKKLRAYDNGYRYLMVDLVINGKKIKCRVNRLIAFAFTDNKDALKNPKCYVSHHKNHDSKDNRLENLELMKFWEHVDLHRAKKDSKKPIEEKFQLDLDEDANMDDDLIA